MLVAALLLKRGGQLAKGEKDVVENFLNIPDEVSQCTELSCIASAAVFNFPEQPDNYGPIQNESQIYCTFVFFWFTRN